MLHVVDLDGRGRARPGLPGIVGLASPTWVAGDTDDRRRRPGGRGHTDLYRVRVADGAIDRADQGRQRRGRSGAHPTRRRSCSSSDRERRDAGQQHAVLRYDLATGRSTRLTSGERERSARRRGRPTARRSRSSPTASGIDDLWLWRDGQRAARLALPRADLRPGVAPDGKALLFAGQSGWSFHLYEVPIAPVDSLWTRAGGLDPQRRVRVAASRGRARRAPTRAALVARRRAERGRARSRARRTGGGGGMVALSDVLGNEGYYLFLVERRVVAGGFLDGMEFGVDLLQPRAAAQLRRRRVPPDPRSTTPTSTSSAASGASAARCSAAYPLSKFQRVEARRCCATPRTTC